MSTVKDDIATAGRKFFEAQNAAEAEPTKQQLDAELIRAMTEDADEIIALRKQNAELVAVLEKIASLRYSNTSAASIAQSALDTMRLLNDPNRRTD